MIFFSYALVILAVILFLYYVHRIQFATRKLPPGPFVAPFYIGNLLSIIFCDPLVLLNPFKMPTWKYFDNWSRRFGDIISFEVGGYYTVVVSSYELMNELANTEEYSCKFSDKILTYPRTFNKELGILFVSNPDIWMEMKKFTQKTLRNFGFCDREKMESLIKIETISIIKDFQDAIETQEGVLKIRANFTLPIHNVLWHFVAGKRYEQDDKCFAELMRTNFEMMKSSTVLSPAQILDGLMKKAFPSRFKDNLRERALSKCLEFAQSLVQERKKEGSYKTNPQNYIDMFLHKIDDESMYTEEQLVAMLMDLFQSGSTTTNGTLNYALLYLMLNSKLQERCQAEIDAIVPANTNPTLKHTERMPFLQAVILETHRLANIVPHPVPRLVPQDCVIRGYKIPKGTLIISNHYSVHMNERIWGDPQCFRPERFINHDGEFVLDRRVIHFGFGKRYCMGYPMASSILSLMLVTLLKYFTFTVVPGTLPPSTDPEIGLDLCPLEFSVYLSNRMSV